MGRRTALLQAGWVGSRLRPHREILGASRDPERHWNARLQRLLPALASSAYGRSIGLDRVRSLADFQQLPTSDWEMVAPWAERIAAGEAGVLTSEPVELLEPTGGSSGGTKLVPYTRRLRREFDEAVGAWMVDLHHRDPALFGRRHYWSVSRAVKQARTSAGGLPIGLEDDSAYFGPVTRWALRQIFAVPPDVARSPTLERWRTRTLRYLLEADDLGLISVWSPTFLTRLLAAVPEVKGLSRSAAGRVSTWERSGRLQDLFPRLRCISAWGDGFARAPFEVLAGQFERVQPKGLLATEGVVSIPWGPVGAGNPATTGSVVVPMHLVELRDEAGRVRWPWQVEVQGRYQPLITTGGGLVRYALPDQVEVVGSLGRLPRIRVVGRLDRGSDLVGEKLTPGFVQPILEALDVRFAMLFPHVDHYVLVCDRPVSAERVEHGLLGAHHYAYARELGQLGPVEVRVVGDAWARWEQACEAQGWTLGEQKPGPLETRSALRDAMLGG